jgi:prepilin-type N-terminal cleavage/methylation domain-containing protein
VKPPRSSSRAGFTLVELLVGTSLALIIMAAVLSTFAFLGRNLNRLALQQKLESEGRQALAYFGQDVRAAGAVPIPAAWSATTAYAVGDVSILSNQYYRAIRASTNQTPPNATYWTTHDYGTCLVLDVADGAGTNRVIYNSYASATTVTITSPALRTVSIPAGSLTRTSPAGSAPVTLLSNILIVAPATTPATSRFYFRYYDFNDVALAPTGANNKVSSIKKVAMNFSTRTGSLANGTRTPVFQGASPRLAVRNITLLE